MKEAKKDNEFVLSVKEKEELAIARASKQLSGVKLPYSTTQKKRVHRYRTKKKASYHCTPQSIRQSDATEMGKVPFRLFPLNSGFLPR